jgi:hypothetical protein
MGAPQAPAAKILSPHALRYSEFSLEDRLRPCPCGELVPYCTVESSQHLRRLAPGGNRRKVGRDELLRRRTAKIERCATSVDAFYRVPARSVVTHVHHVIPQQFHFARSVYE